MESETTAEFTDVGTSSSGESEGLASGSGEVEGEMFYWVFSNGMYAGGASTGEGEGQATDVTGFSPEEEEREQGTRTEVSTETSTSVGGQEPEGSSEEGPHRKRKHKRSHRKKHSGKKQKGPVPVEPSEATQAAQLTFAEDFEKIFSEFGSEDDVYEPTPTTTTTTSTGRPTTRPLTAEPTQGKNHTSIQISSLFEFLDVSSVKACRSYELVTCCRRASYICSCGFLDDGSLSVFS